MALEYDLVLAGKTPAGLVAERAFPDAGERPGGPDGLLSADLRERYGFGVTVTSGENGYFEVSGDEGPWEWEPESYVLVTFRMDKFGDLERQAAEMLVAVRRVLTTGVEDAVLDLNGDILLLSRLGGDLAKHGRDGWWASYPAADRLIPG